MKKLLKWLAALAVAGTVAGLFASYLYKPRTDDDAKGGHAADDDEFNLDTDLQPISGREYVPLNKTGGSSTVDKSEC